MSNASRNWDITAIQRCYRWMAPVYDALFARLYRRLRRESLQMLDLRETDSVLFVGVGTGLDLPLLPPVARLAATDLSLPMLRRAAKARSITPVNPLLADGGQLPIRTGSVSVVVLHLVLCSSPEGREILREAARVLAPGGRVAVLDHFAHQSRLSRWRRWLAAAPWLFGTRFNRRLEPMLTGLPFEVVSDERKVLGLYRLLLLRRFGDS